MADREVINIQIALKEWRQGDFALDVGSFIYGDRSELTEGMGIDAFFDETDPLGLVIVSQTCDVVSDPSKNPWIVVCPLVKIEPTRKVDVERGGVPRFAVIENSAEDVVAEIGRTLTVSKELVSTWPRNVGFTDGQKAVDFARSLERCYGRFAFPDKFNESIVPLIDKLKGGYGKTASLAGRVARSIAELRVRPSPSWEADEVSVRFYVFIKAQHQREASREDINSFFNDILGKIKWSDGFSLDDFSFEIGTFEDFSAMLYIESFPLDINSLSFAARYKKIGVSNDDSAKLASSVVSTKLFTPTSAPKGKKAARASVPTSMLPTTDRLEEQ